MKPTTPIFKAAAPATGGNILTGVLGRSIHTMLLLAASLGHSVMLHAQTQFADDYVPQPAYAAQTRAPLANQSPRLTITTLVSGLSKPWALEFMPDGRMLLAELPGRMRIVEKDGTVSAPLAGLPAIRAFTSNGLHGLALDPGFQENRLIYFTGSTRKCVGRRWHFSVAN